MTRYWRSGSPKITSGFPVCKITRSRAWIGRDVQWSRYANKCLSPVYYGRYLGFDKPPHLWGGWAEYVYVDLEMLPGTKVYKLPDDMSLRLGALSEPLTSGIEEGIGRAVADAIAMKTVKSTIVPWPELVQ